VIAAPEYCEPLIGWRAWRAVERGGDVCLMSLFHRVRWPWLEALDSTCQAWQLPWRRARRRHHPPHTDCQCGIYASTLEVASTYAPALTSRTQAAHAIVGTVSLWGDVLEYSEGWRASLAYPEHLYVLYPASSRTAEADRVAAHLERYGVPVETVRAWRTHEVAEELAQLVRGTAAAPVSRIEKAS
jgi:hypothetical protein